jgi:hypothetical protein
MANNIGANAMAADSSIRSVSLAQELENDFHAFKGKVLAVVDGAMEGQIREALEDAQHLWVQRAQGLTGAQAQLGQAMTRNMQGLLDADHAGGNSIRSVFG